MERSSDGAISETWLISLNRSIAQSRVHFQPASSSNWATDWRGMSTTSSHSVHTPTRTLEYDTRERLG
ncbi:MAG: hypothetical protein ABR582_06700 [Gemmatimonadaceae bacterium]